MTKDFRAKNQDRLQRYGKLLIRKGSQSGPCMEEVFADIIGGRAMRRRTTASGSGAEIFSDSVFGRGAMLLTSLVSTQRPPHWMVACVDWGKAGTHPQRSGQACRGHVDVPICYPVGRAFPPFRRAALCTNQNPSDNPASASPVRMHQYQMVKPADSTSS